MTAADDRIRAAFATGQPLLLLLALLGCGDRAVRAESWLAHDWCTGDDTARAQAEIDRGEALCGTYCVHRSLVARWPGQAVFGCGMGDAMIEWNGDASHCIIVLDAPGATVTELSIAGDAACGVRMLTSGYASVLHITMIGGRIGVNAGGVRPSEAIERWWSWD